MIPEDRRLDPLALGIALGCLTWLFLAGVAIGVAVAARAWR
jgi:hypothetical protein